MFLYRLPHMVWLYDEFPECRLPEFWHLDTVFQDPSSSLEQALVNSRAQHLNWLGASEYLCKQLKIHAHWLLNIINTHVAVLLKNHKSILHTCIIFLLNFVADSWKVWLYEYFETNNKYAHVGLELTTLTAAMLSTHSLTVCSIKTIPKVEFKYLQHIQIWSSLWTSEKPGFPAVCYKNWEVQLSAFGIKLNLTILNFVGSRPEMQILVLAW